MGVDNGVTFIGWFLGFCVVDGGGGRRKVVGVIKKTISTSTDNNTKIINILNNHELL